MEVKGLQEPIERHMYLGGVDIAQIEGVSPFGTPTTLYTTKIEEQSFEPTEKMKWGVKIEPLIVKEIGTEYLTPELAKKYGAYRFFKNKEGQLTVIDKEYPFLCGSIDCVKDDILYEIKLCSNESIFENGVPLYYQYQVQWYFMLLPNLKEARVVVLFNGAKLEEYTLYRDEELIAKLRKDAVDFWNNHILTKTPPEEKKESKEDNISESNYEAIRKEYIAYKIKKEEAEEHKNKAYQLASELGVVDGFFGGKKVFTMKPKLTKRLDTTSLKKELDVSNYYKEEESIYRRIYL